MIRSSLLVAVLVLGAAPCAPAQDSPASAAEFARPALSVGDAAPALSIAEWVKGSKVKSFEKGKVYVVEFWATWCGPCRESIPHLSKLQAAFKEKGVTIIGVTSPDRRNDLPKVKKMVETYGEKMAYTVAWDTERKTNTAYMKASAQLGIPTSFVVDKAGKIAFIGHPSELDEVLPAVIAGTWDTKAAREKFLADVQDNLQQVKLSGLLEAKDYAGYQAMVAKLVDAGLADDAQKLNGFAWTIVDPEGPIPEKQRDLDLALRLAQRAVKLASGEAGVAGILDTLATAQAAKGDLAAAIETQTKAVGLSKPGSDERKELKARLESFQAKQGGARAGKGM